VRIHSGFFFKGHACVFSVDAPKGSALRFEQEARVGIGRLLPLSSDRMCPRDSKPSFPLPAELNVKLEQYHKNLVRLKSAQH
jgi:hypothetical protein